MAEGIQEGSPWFWKIFGGTIIGAITFLMVAHISNINTNIERAKNETKLELIELRSEVKELRSALDKNRERVVALEQSSLKDRTALIESAQKEMATSLDDRKQKIIALETTCTHLKEEVKTLQTANTKLIEQLQQLREKVVTPKVEPPKSKEK